MTTDNLGQEALVVLRAARALLERGWVQLALARDADGMRVDPCSEKATCWCALGAVTAAAAKIPDPFERDRVHIFVRDHLRVVVADTQGYREGNYNSVAGYNDTAGDKEEVLDLFDKTIRFVKETYNLDEKEKCNEG